MGGPTTTDVVEPLCQGKEAKQESERQDISTLFKGCQS